MLNSSGSPPSIAAAAFRSSPVPAPTPREAIELTRHAFEVGVDATLQVAPYYNKPSQEGLYRHFTTVAQEGGLPVILYNVPGRTVADISNATVLRLADNPNIIGLKDATGDIGRGASLLARLPERFATALVAELPSWIELSTRDPLARRRRHLGHGQRGTEADG